MPQYSYVGESLVDAKIVIARPYPAGQPSGTPSMSSPQHDEDSPVGGKSSRTTVVTPSAEADADVENSPEWTYVQNWRPNPNDHPHGWVGVDFAGSNNTERQTNGSASSSVSHLRMPAQQTGTPIASGSSSSSVSHLRMPAQQTGTPSASIIQGRRYEVATPAGRLSLTNAEYREVARRVLHARNTMGGVYCNVDRYIGMFGIPGTEPATMFGTHITHGLLHLLYQYVFRSRFRGGHEYLGWFLCPREFSAENARLPASDHDTRWYPAVFVVWDQDDDEANMACEAILLQGSRPWRVHVSRMWLSMSVAEAREQISQRDAMAPN